MLEDQRLVSIVLKNSVYNGWILKIWDWLAFKTRMESYIIHSRFFSDRKNNKNDDNFDRVGNWVAMKFICILMESWDQGLSGSHQKEWFDEIVELNKSRNEKLKWKNMEGENDGFCKCQSSASISFSPASWNGKEVLRNWNSNLATRLSCTNAAGDRGSSVSDEVKLKRRLSLPLRVASLCMALDFGFWQQQRGVVGEGGSKRPRYTANPIDRLMGPSPSACPSPEELSDVTGDGRSDSAATRLRPTTTWSAFLAQYDAGTFKKIITHMIDYY